MARGILRNGIKENGLVRKTEYLLQEKENICFQAHMTVFLERLLINIT